MDGKGILDMDGVRRDGQRSGKPFSFKVPVT
jgi:hypothetical protein